MLICEPLLLIRPFDPAKLPFSFSFFPTDARDGREKERELRDLGPSSRIDFTMGELARRLKIIWSFELGSHL